MMRVASTQDEFTQEAGQLLINKSQHLDALYLVQEQLKDWRYWFDFSDGDKDLFRYAFLALRKPLRWAVPGRHLASASVAGSGALINEQDSFCGHTMMQHDHEGEPLFVHANLLKRILGQFGIGNTWGSTLQLALSAFPPPEPVPETVEEQEDREKEEHQGDEYEWRAEKGVWSQVKGEGRIQAPAPKAGEPTRRPVAELSRLLKEALAAVATARPGSPFSPKGDAKRSRRQLIDPLASIKSFPTLADHLANPVHPSGSALLDAPYHVRQRALLEPLLAAGFAQGHRSNMYVLCVTLDIEAPHQPGLNATSLSSASGREDDWCGKPAWVDEGEAVARLESVQWRDHPRLAGFEKLFYDVGGTANGRGFRR